MCPIERPSQLITFVFLDKGVYGGGGGEME